VTTVLGEALRKLYPGCVGKRRHATEAEALKQLHSLMRMNEANGEAALNAALGVYRCFRCEQYHVGRQKRDG
jgi:hypothetical protein